MSSDITNIVEHQEMIWKCKEMVVLIAFIAVETGVATSYRDCMQVVRRTPWGRFLGMMDCSEVILNSGLLETLASEK